MANRRLASRDLTVEAFDNIEIQTLLDWISRASSGSRWVIGRPGGPTAAQIAVWPLDGTTAHVDDPESFVRDKQQIGLVFPGESAAAFVHRFEGVDDHVALMRVAGKLAPLLPDLHPEIYGIDYDLRPSAKTQRLINLFGRFLPKNKAIAIQSEVDGKPMGIYVAFNRCREVERIVGLGGWPQDVVAGGPMKKLETLGVPVEVGVRITADAFVGMFEDGLNRAGYARLFKKREIVLDPLPLAPKLALKAARII